MQAIAGLSSFVSIAYMQILNAIYVVAVDSFKVVHALRYDGDVFLRTYIFCYETTSGKKITLSHLRRESLT
jgi:hypothetical protein